MGEVLSVAKEESIKYEGIFLVKSVLTLLKKRLEELGYHIGESSRTQIVTSEGKHTDISWSAEAKTSDYSKKSWRIEITFDKVKDKIVTRKGKKERFQTGEVIIGISANVETDVEKRWKDSSPILFLLRTFFEKHVYSSYLSTVKDEVRHDVDNVKKHLQSFLNMEKY